MISSKEWVSVRKFLAFVGLSGVLVSGLSLSTTEAFAADDALTVDCSDGGVTAGQTFSNSVVGDDIVITNSSSSDACALVLATSVATAADTADVGVADDVTGTAPNLTIAASGVVTLTIVDSGTFTIESAGAGDAAQTFIIDACSLPGAGVEASPWEIDSQADFQLIGDTTGSNSCILGGYYRQVAHLTGVEALDSYSDDRVTGDFTGTYDGDHYSISLSGGDGTGGWADGYTTSRLPLFNAVSGRIQKVRLQGSLLTDGGISSARASLVATLTGVVSESESTVSIGVNPANDEIRAGGLVAIIGGGRIEYSRYVGSFEWNSTVTVSSNVNASRYFGGLVAFANGSGGEIRDSYSRATVEWNNDTFITSAGTAAFEAGGLLGHAQTPAAVTIIRSYGTPAYLDTGVADPATLNDAELGGLVGDVASSPEYVSSFFLVTSEASDAEGTGGAVSDYVSDGPVAVPLSSAELSTLSTFQTKELGSSGNPGGDEIAAAASDESGSASSADYRWAIEQGSVLTFVASRYDDSGDADPSDDVDDYTNRDLYADTLNAETYRTRGVTASVTGYPTLGRVWEICSGTNDGYPVLVWEEETCPSTGGSGSGSSERSQAAEARSLGFTEEEYLRFLDSGLTWEQFTLQLQAEQSAALASTGLSAERMGLAAAGSLGLLLGGLVLLWVNRRRGVGRSST